MATKPNRLKSAAAPYASQTKEDCQQDIKHIGNLRRKHAVKLAALNDKVAQLTADAATELDSLQTDIAMLQKGVQTWCEANREELCGKGKTANLITGEVSWRQRRPSVGIRGVDAVLKALKKLGFDRFIRTKEEPNKEAMLNEPEVAKAVAGITINSGAEDFIIAPFEVEVTT